MIQCDLIRWNAEFKLDEINGKAVLFYAARNECIAVVTELHDKNFDLNITGDEGKTALSYANRNHSMDVLCELIVCGAEFKLVEIDGKAFLLYAASKNYKHVVKHLHSAGLTLIQQMSRARQLYSMAMNVSWMPYNRSGRNFYRCKRSLW